MQEHLLKIPQARLRELVIEFMNEVDALELAQRRTGDLLLEWLNAKTGKVVVDTGARIGAPGLEYAFSCESSDEVAITKLTWL